MATQATGTFKPDYMTNDKLEAVTNDMRRLFTGPSFMPIFARYRFCAGFLTENVIKTRGAAKILFLNISNLS